MNQSDNDKPTVGAQIPGRLYNLINLYSIAKGTSKSQIIRDALLLWADENEVMLKDLIQEVRREYKTDWLRVEQYEDVSKYEYHLRRHDELTEQGVPDKIIERIFEDF